MPSYRQEKISRFVFRKDKNLCLGAGILLNRGLAAAGIDPETAAVQTEENGKPRLAGQGGIFFNLSHSGSYALACFSDAETGCDIEVLAPIEIDFAKRFFTPAEYRTIKRCADAKSKQDTFFRLWTLKESYMKFTGQGLLRPPDSFEICLDPPVTVSQGGARQQAFFREYGLEGYKISVCSAKNEFEQEMTLEVLA